MFLLMFLIVFILTIYLWLREHYSYWRKRNVPFEEPQYFVGNMRGIGRDYHWKDINQRIYRQFKTVSPVVGFYTFLIRAAMITDLDLIKQIMIKDFQSFPDRNLFHNERDDPLTGNLLFLDGDQWRVLRQKLSPVFTTGKIKYMFPAMVAVAKQLPLACEKLMQTNAGILEIKDLCARYTTDVIGTCAFGLECNSLLDAQAEFRQMGRSIFEKPRHSGVVQAFMFTNPALARKLRMKNFRDEISDFFMKAVQQTVEFRQRNNLKRNDFLDLLMEMKERRDRLVDQGQKVDENDLTSGLSIEQLAAQAMMFFLAGFETSSTTLLSRFRFDRCASTQIPLRISKLNFLIGSESGISLKMEKL